MTQECETAAPGSQVLPAVKWELYARERALCASGEDAQVRAGYPPRSGMYSKLDRKRAIRERIAFLVRDDENLIHERRERTRAWLHHIRDMDRFELFEEVEYERNTGSDEKPVLIKERYLRLKPLAQLSADQRMVFEGLEKDGRPIMPSKLAAAAQLAKLDGLDKPTKAELAGPGGVPLVPVINLSGKPVEADEAA